VIKDTLKYFLTFYNWGSGKQSGVYCISTDYATCWNMTWDSYACGNQPTIYGDGESTQMHTAFSSFAW